MTEFVPLPETGHVGQAIVVDGYTIVVDPPLTMSITVDAIAELPAVRGVLDTELATWRMSGASLVASHLGVPHWVVGDQVGDRAMVGAIPLESVPSPGLTVEDVDGVPIVTINGGIVLIGSHDRHGPAGVLEALASRWPEARFVGSAGVHTAAEVAALATSPPSPLNREAVVLTNRGEVAMHWADPRFVAEVHQVTADYLAQRAGSPWAPTVVFLDGDPSDDDTLHIAPERLAAAVPTLMAHRELVIAAADPGLAEQAAGFLARVGLNPVSWTAVG